MTLRVYNTLSGKKEEFIPIDPPKVGLYACGVTVYDYCHIGHARSAVAFDVIRRYLEFSGYEVTYVRNYTDIDDKIIAKSLEENRDWGEIAETYIRVHDEDMDALGILRAHEEPRATDYIPQIIETVNTLVDKEFAYDIDGDVYYEVGKFEPYGKLSGRKPDELKAGARIEVDERKRDPLDFALWKRSKPGEPIWESPWGDGRPGWHIECSAMSMALLGQSFDIHGGGKDLIFPHHENEIAQSEAANDKPFAKYWIHNGFVNIDNEKMSKSLGNFFTIREVLEKYPAEVIRLFLLSTHYRSPLDFSDFHMDEARVRYERFMNLFVRVARAGTLDRDVDNDEGESLRYLTENARPAFVEAMDDDFNTAAALGHLFSALPVLNAVLDRADASDGTVSEGWREGVDGFFIEFGPVLGFFEDGIEEGNRYFGIEDAGGVPDDEAHALLAGREKARQDKDWVRADELRDQIAELGFSIQDTPQGATLVPIRGKDS